MGKPGDAGEEGLRSREAAAGGLAARSRLGIAAPGRQREQLDPSATLAAEREANEPSPEYEIVTVAYRSREPLERMLHFLPRSVRVIVVDNSREHEDLTSLVALHPNVRYLDSGGNIGFGAACNLGARAATSPFVVFLNPDTEPDPAILDALMHGLQQEPTCAACAPALIDRSGAPQRGGGGWQPTVLRALVHASGIDHILPRAGIWLRSPGTRPLQVEWLAGTCLAIRRQLFLDVGGFDHRYFLYQEDMDLGRRIRERGSRLVLRGDLRLRHALGGSSSGDGATDLWRLRGAMLVTYLHRHYTPLQARLVRGLLSAGFLLRAALYLLTRNQRRRPEMWRYARTLLCRSRR